MDKKWVKLLKDFQGKPAGEVVQLDAAKADTLIELSHAEAHEDPTAGIVEQAVGALDERIKQAAVLAADAAFQKVAASLKGKGGSSKRPSIQTHDNELDDPTGGFKHMGEYAKCVRLAAQGKAVDERLQRIAKAAHGASEGSDADGGFAVPVQYAGEVFNDIQKQDSLMDLCFRIPMTSNSIKLPAINYTSQSGFGVQAYWVGEGQAPSTSKPNYRQPQLTLNALSALVPVTAELLEDGIAVAPIISFLAGEAITYKLNDAILNGDAVGKPQGIIPHAATVTVNKEGGQAAATFNFANARKMRARLWGNLGRAVWLHNVDVEPEMFGISDTAGNNLYWAPGTLSMAPDEGRLMGVRTRRCINCATLGTTGDIGLFDLKNYALGYKTTGVEQAISLHLYFDTREVAYRWSFRVDGRPLRDAALTPAKGANSLSPFVILQTR